MIKIILLMGLLNSAPVQSINPVAGAAIQGASGLLGSLVQNWMNRKQQDRAFAQNVKMWNMQNKYNSPASQMARFKQAGLNPHLIYGQGSAGNSSMIPKYQAPHQDVNVEGFANLMTQAENVRLMRKNQAYIDSQITNKEADTSLKGVMMLLKKTENMIKKANYKEWYALQDKRMQATNQAFKLVNEKLRKARRWNQWEEDNKQNFYNYFRLRGTGNLEKEALSRFFDWWDDENKNSVKKTVKKTNDAIKKKGGQKKFYGNNPYQYGARGYY